MPHPYPWSDDINVDPASVPSLVYATRDASGAVVGLSVGGKRQLPRSVKSNIFTRIPTGHTAAVASYGGFTYHVQAELAAKPYAVRIGFANCSTSTQAVAGSFGFGTLTSTSTSAEAKGANVATWIPLTFAGAASATMPVRSSADANTPVWTFSDWIGCEAPDRTDGGEGAVIHVNTLPGTAGGGGEATCFGNIWSASAAQEVDMAHKWRGFKSTTAVDYATTNQAAFAGSTVAAHQAIIIQYVSMTPGVTLLTTGNSIWAGAATSGNLVANGYGWVNVVRDLLSSADFPVETCCLAAPSQTVSKHYARLSDISAEIGNCLFFPLYFSTNDVTSTIDAAEVTVMKKQFGLYLRLAEASGWIPYLQTSAPANATEAAGGLGGASAKDFGTTDALRTAMDAELLSSMPFVFDVAAVLSGSAVASGSAAGQIEYKSGWSTDGLHPNDVGYAAWGAALADDLRGRIW